MDCRIVQDDQWIFLTTRLFQQLSLEVVNMPDSPPATMANLDQLLAKLQTAMMKEIEKTDIVSVQVEHFTATLVNCLQNISHHIYCV